MFTWTAQKATERALLEASVDCGYLSFVFVFCFCTEEKALTDLLRTRREELALERLDILFLGESTAGLFLYGEKETLLLQHFQNRS